MKQNLTLHVTSKVFFIQNLNKQLKWKKIILKLHQKGIL
jgi:hypothetical protein